MDSSHVTGRTRRAALTIHSGRLMRPSLSRSSLRKTPSTNCPWKTRHTSTKPSRWSASGYLSGAASVVPFVEDPSAPLRHSAAERKPSEAAAAKASKAPANTKAMAQASGARSTPASKCVGNHNSHTASESGWSRIA